MRLINESLIIKASNIALHAIYNKKAFPRETKQIFFFFISTSFSELNVSSTSTSSLFHFIRVVPADA